MPISGPTDEIEWERGKEPTRGFRYAPVFQQKASAINNRREFIGQELTDFTWIGEDGSGPLAGEDDGSPDGLLRKWSINMGQALLAENRESIEYCASHEGEKDGCKWEWCDEDGSTYSGASSVGGDLARRDGWHEASYDIKDVVDDLRWKKCTEIIDISELDWDVGRRGRAYTFYHDGSATFPGWGSALLTNIVYSNGAKYGADFFVTHGARPYSWTFGWGTIIWKLVNFWGAFDVPDVTIKYSTAEGGSYTNPGGSFFTFTSRAAVTDEAKWDSILTDMPGSLGGSFYSTTTLPGSHEDTITLPGDEDLYLGAECLLAITNTSLVNWGDADAIAEIACTWSLKDTDGRYRGLY